MFFDLINQLAFQLKQPAKLLNITLTALTMQQTQQSR